MVSFAQLTCGVGDRYSVLTEFEDHRVIDEGEESGASRRIAITSSKLSSGLKTCPALLENHEFSQVGTLELSLFVGMIVLSVIIEIIARTQGSGVTIRHRESL